MSELLHNPAMAMHRKTMRRYEEPGHARFLTFSCYQRLPLFSNDRIKEAFVERLASVRVEFNVELYAWVIMPEHVHLIVRPQLPEFPLKGVLHSLKRPFAEAVIRRRRSIDARVLAKIIDRRGAAHFWQAGGGYDRNITSIEDLVQKIEYLHDNPRRRAS